MAKGWIDRIIPTHLTIIMSMNIYPSGSYVSSVCINNFLGFARHMTKVSNLSILNSYITRIGLTAQTINDGRALN